MNPKGITPLLLLPALMFALEIFMTFLTQMGNFCPRINALKRSITASFEALILMSMVYLKDFSGAANIKKRQKKHTNIIRATQETL